MKTDHWQLYEHMLRSRLFEEAVDALWKEGRISGEMHLGTGEEAVDAGVVTRLQDGDAIALDHRGTPPLLMRGIDPAALLKEFLGRTDGLCGGSGGHMHLFAPEFLAASSGIVGSSGPAAAGFALAAQHLRPQAIAVAFFGEGAMNQGMLMESMNLASAWSLPVLFVCKDDSWSITTESETVTGGTIEQRARGFGLRYVSCDGRNVVDCAVRAGETVAGIRSGNGPAFLHASCVHLEGHFLGYQLLRLTRDPLHEMPAVAGGLTRALFASGGAGSRARLAGLGSVMTAMLHTLRDPRRDSANDPVQHSRKSLETEDAARLKDLETAVSEDTAAVVLEAVREEDMNPRTPRHMPGDAS